MLPGITGLQLVGGVLLGCGALLFGGTYHAALMRLLTEAFPVWRGGADTPEEQRRIVQTQMRITAVVLLLLGGIAWLAG